MLTNITDVKNTSRRSASWWRRVVFPLLIALLALGFVGVGTGSASPATQQHPATVSSQHADASPSMAIYTGMVYVGWTGRNAAHNLNLMSYNINSKTFGPTHVLTDTTLAGSGPNLENYNGHLYVAWQGTDHRLNIGQYNPADPTHLANKVTLSDRSNVAPSIVAFNGHLYLSWKGTDGRLNLISSSNGTTFGSKVTYGITVRTSPSLVEANVYMYIVWEDTSADSHIVFGRFDPARPGVLSPVVTLASTSQLPVGVIHASVPAPYVWVAWRTADDSHIRLGVFEGGQFLHNPVYTTQTTSYGPALTLQFMGWTGTDAAQTVNVSPVSTS